MSETAPPLILIISLAESCERRDYLTSQLHDLGIAYHIIDAVDGRAFDVTNHPNYDRRKRLNYFGKDLLGAELGCLLSHKKAMEYIVDHHLPAAMIFEDDTVIENGPEFLKLLAVLPNPVSGERSKPFPRPDLVRLIGKKKIYQSPYKILSQLTPHTQLARTQGIPGSANAYFLSNCGAQKLLPFLSKPYLPVDILMGHSWLTDVDNLITIPSPVHDRYWNHSYIGNDRFSSSLSPTDQIPQGQIPQDQAPKARKNHRSLIPSLHKIYFKITTAVFKRLNFHGRNWRDRRIE